MSESPANRVNGCTKSAADKMGKLWSGRNVQSHTEARSWPNFIQTSDDRLIFVVMFVTRHSM